MIDASFPFFSSVDICFFSGAQYPFFRPFFCRLEFFFFSLFLIRTQNCISFSCVIFFSFLECNVQLLICIRCVNRFFVYIFYFVVIFRFFLLLFIFSLFRYLLFLSFEICIYLIGNGKIFRACSICLVFKFLIYFFSIKKYISN